MSNYAKINHGIVDNIIVCSDSDILLVSGELIKILEGDVVDIGYSYDPTSQKFIAPKPYDSWVLNSEYIWESPIGENPDVLTKKWDESLQNWVDRFN